MKKLFILILIICFVIPFAFLNFGCTDDTSNDTSYSRPSGYRKGVRDKVWENSKDKFGRVKDPVTGQVMSKDKPWDMGHKPGYEFRKMRDSAKENGVSRKKFLDEYNNPNNYRPELPSSNRSHKGEDKTDSFFGSW